MEQDIIAFLVVLVVMALGGAWAVRRAQRGALPAGRKREALPSGKPVEVPSEADEGVHELAPGEVDPAIARRAALTHGLEKTRRGGFIARIGQLFKGKQIDKATLDELEEVLLTADIGVKTANKMFESLRSELSRDQLTDSDVLWRRIREQSREILDVKAPPLDFARAKPFVILMIGVNGVGKTTTLGKLAALYAGAGKKVIMAAGDTFRAAAVEQLEIWGQRSGCEVVRGKDKQDPSSVIFEAVKRAVDEGFDIVLADTAGRLHTKVELMEELKKVRRVTEKAMPGAPHETFLVVDATTGQNAIAQAQLFKEAMDITGVVLTKLDGTAKGGVILGICDELAVPVRYIGVGEKVEDLREFVADEFVAALYDVDEADAAA